MVHTPDHASWLNQVEVYFSVVQRKVVSPNDFTNLAQVGDRLRAFEDRYNAWRVTTVEAQRCGANTCVRKRPFTDAFNAETVRIGRLSVTP
jgi:hypothetical protein